MATTGVIGVMLFTVVWSYTCTASVCCGLLYADRQRRQHVPAAAAVRQRAAPVRRRALSVLVVGALHWSTLPASAVAVARLSTPSSALADTQSNVSNDRDKSHRLRASAFDRHVAQPSSSQAFAFDESPKLVAVVADVSHWAPALLLDACER